VKRKVDSVGSPCYTFNTLKKYYQPLIRKTKMKFISKNTKTYKVFDALYNGEKLTAAEAKHRFGVQNIRAEATRIRQNGYAVYANSRVAGNGVRVTEYEIGKPSREIVALGYKARALGMHSQAL
jgi:hypothetical protein